MMNLFTCNEKRLGKRWGVLVRIMRKKCGVVGEKMGCAFPEVQGKGVLDSRDYFKSKRKSSEMSITLL